MESASLIELQEGEEIRYSHPNIKVSIKSDDDEVVLIYGTLHITTQRVLYIQSLPKKVCIAFRYQNCITHGIDKQNLVCNISDLQEHNDDDDDEDEENGIEKEPDFFLEKIKSVDSDAPEDWINLVGNYQVIFHYGDFGQEQLKKVFDTFSECSALNPDEDQGEDHANIFDSEFITANDIDENGNVRINEEFAVENGGYEDDDEGLGEIMQKGELGGKKHKKEGDNMEME
jgi:hypothetical protein